MSEAMKLSTWQISIKGGDVRYVMAARAVTGLDGSLILMDSDGFMVAIFRDGTYRRAVRMDSDV